MTKNAIFGTFGLRILEGLGMEIFGRSCGHLIFYGYLVIMGSNPTGLEV
jgi:hypothetical protein